VKRQFRKLTIGRLVYLIYYKPLATVRRSIREGGPINQLVTESARQEMERTARELEPVKASQQPSSSFEVHMLTGARFWYQSAFCVRSLVAHSTPEVIEPVFYDDGTLGDYQQQLHRIFPSARFVSYDESKGRLDRYLPEAEFPYLRERWQNYPNIRKLIDPHIGSSGWKLVLDSDMLFFRRPNLVMEWLKNPTQPLYMLDTQESYGYSRENLAELARAQLPRHLNVGLCALRSDTICWKEIESWTEKLAASGRTTYFLEQALIAMLLAEKTCTLAQAEDYIAYPALAEVLSPTAAMHHYVDTSKIHYFRHGWKTCLEIMFDQEQRAENA